MQYKIAIGDILDTCISREDISAYRIAIEAKQLSLTSFYLLLKRNFQEQKSQKSYKNSIDG